MRRPQPGQRGVLTAPAPGGGDETLRLHAVPNPTAPGAPAPVPMPRREPAVVAEPEPVPTASVDGDDGVALAARRSRGLDDDGDEFSAGWWGDDGEGPVAATPQGFGPTAPAARANGNGNGNGHNGAGQNGNGQNANGNGQNGNGRLPGNGALPQRPVPAATELRVVPTPRDEPVAPVRAVADERQGDPPAATGDIAGDGAPFTLRRRVPQAHLTPELRQPAAAEAPAPAVPTASAASALSRYQASRQAAQDVVDGEPGDGERGSRW
jgi:hypothetical protein